MGYEIKSVEYHQSALERISASLERIMSSPEFEYSESGLSVWASQQSISYHRHALEVLKLGAESGIEGPAAELPVLVSESGEVVSSRYYGKSFSGHVSYSWWLVPELAERYGRKYVPKGERSKIQKALGLHEEYRVLPIKPYFEASCAFRGAPVHLKAVVA